MDSTEINKIVGGVIAAFLVFLLLGFASGKIYGTRAVHGDHHPVLAFAVEIEEAAGGEPEEEITIAMAIASADADAGKKIFNQCRSCHKVEDGKNGIGPHLWGVVGRERGSVDGFGYSATLAGMDGVWGLEELSGFLENPKGYAPGTSMGYGGLRDVQDRANLIAYLNEADGSPVEFSAAAAPVVAASAPAEGEAETADAPAEGDAETAAAPAEGEAETAAAPAAGEAETAAASTDGETAAAPTEGETGAAATEEEVQVAAVGFPAGDAGAGKKAFRACAACHKVEDGKNGVGPHLWGIIGRDIAGVEGFNYSKALEGKEGVWTASALSAFLENPRGWAKGTKMAYPGLKKEQARIDLITYLNEADGSPDPLN